VEPDEEIAGAVPIGRPVANTRLYILDEYLNAVPVGVAGELYIAGAGVGRGYLQRAELTAERFVPEPYGAESGARMYRTGDAARYRGDGEIEYLGRLDEQVKVRGYRIELGEIEAALRGSAGVEEAVVVVREEAGGEKQLVGYVVGGGGEGERVGRIRAHLQEHLPEYMIPATFMFLDSLPLTPRGKVDRAALPAPGGARRELKDSYLAPRDEMEAQLARIWAEIFGIERVGINDQFLELGGHSLLAVQLISRLQAGLQVKVNFRDLFEAPTVAKLAVLINERYLEQKNTETEIKSADDEIKGELAERLDELSDQEVESLLGEMLTEEEIN
jgi:acyl carrier protein